MSIQQTLRQAVEQLQPTSASAQLDAECLLSFILKMDRLQLRITQRDLSTSENQQFETLLARRIQGEPIAYIVGHKEFWGLDFVVNSDVLIPRPETETLVEQALQLIPKQDNYSLVDLGTGSGAIAISIAHERPQASVYATDRSTEALSIARQNAKQNKVKIQFMQGNWLQPLLNNEFDMVLSNPPYIAQDETSEMSLECKYEPQQALFAEQNGLADCKQIAEQALSVLKPDGYLLIEHGYKQAEELRTFCQQLGYESIQSVQDLAGHPRVLVAKRV